MNTEKNKISIVLGKIESMKGDVVLNWITPNLSAATPIFYNLQSAAGVQPINALLTFKLNIEKGALQEGDVVSTIAGLLQYNLMIHAIIEPNPQWYPAIWLNIFKTLNSYKNNNICRDFYLTIPELKTSEECIKNFFSLEQTVENIHFKFIVRSEAERKLITKKFEKFRHLEKKISFAQKIDSFIMRSIKNENIIKVNLMKLFYALPL